MNWMQGTRGAVGKYLLKWLFVPIVLAAIGFYVVGPRLGSPADPPKIDVDPAKGLTPSESAENTSKFKEPDVEVTARPAGRRTRRSSRRAPSRSRVVRQAPEVPSPDEEPPF